MVKIELFFNPLLEKTAQSMPVFSYTAFDENKRRVRGLITNDTPRLARADLRNRGLNVVSINEKQAATGLHGISLRIFQGRRESQLGTFFNELSTLLSVGIPLLDAMDTLCEQSKGRFRHNLLLLRESIASGNSLSEAMTAVSGCFDELTVKMVEVGENSGNLDVVLGKIADFKQKSLELKDRILSAMLYPGIIFTVSIVVTIFLMVVVIPMLLANLAELDRPLPWPTKVVKFVSDGLVNYGWILVLVIATAGVTAAIGLKSYKGRRLRDQIVIKTPLFGALSRKQAIARTAFVIATLIDSGIELVQALGFAKRNAKNTLLKEALEICENQVETGQDIKESLEKTSYFPAVTVQVFSVGQDTGRLSEMLTRLAKDYDRQVEVATNRLSSVIEPIMILVISVFVGFVMFATVLPILEASNVF